MSALIDCSSLSHFPPARVAPPCLPHLLCRAHLVVCPDQAQEAPLSSLYSSRHLCEFYTIFAAARWLHFATAGLMPLAMSIIGLAPESRPPLAHHQTPAKT
jgi:hypothetical protein